MVIFLFVLLFATLVFWFRTSKKNQPQLTMNSIANILTPVSVDPSVVNRAMNLASPNATLIGTSSNKSAGTAHRTSEDGFYHLTINTKLPEIDREKKFYAAWLVQQIPYKYISVGSFTTNDLGDFVLEWNGENGKSYQAFTRVVITLQTKDGNPDPQEHIAEGEFGK